MTDRDAILQRIDRLQTDMNKRLDKQDGALFGDASDPKRPGLVTRVDRIEQSQKANDDNQGIRRGWLMALTGGTLATFAVELWNWLSKK